MKNTWGKARKDHKPHVDFDSFCKIGPLGNMTQLFYIKKESSFNEEYALKNWIRPVVLSNYKVHRSLLLTN